MRIRVKDALPGNGKTVRMMQQMKQTPNQKWIYITPFLAECHRVAGTEYIEKDGKLLPPKGGFKYAEDNQYNCSALKFKHPLAGYKYKREGDKLDDIFKTVGTTKTESMRELLRQGANITSTSRIYKVRSKRLKTLSCYSPKSLKCL